MATMKENGGGIRIPTPEEIEVAKKLYPERYTDKQYPEGQFEEKEE